jgi:colanic acid biosynthesis glycosyl transferase WcaI
MARILFLSYFFSPDGLSTATIVSELAQDLKAKGHDVSVIATHPHYNYEPEARASQPLQRKWGGLYYRSKYHDIPVWHTSIGPRRERGRGRILGYLVYNFISFFLGIFALGGYDVIYVVSPPLTSGIIGRLLGLIKRAKYVYNIQELYPETYITMGAMEKDSTVARFLFRIERIVYRTAHALTPICNIFAEDVIAKDIPSEKVHVIPNFVDVDFLKPDPKDNPLAQELGLVDKYVVLYAGNIGLSQSFDTLLDAAERLQDESRIVVMIVGDGARRDEIENMVKTRKLTNVVMLPYQPRSRVPDIYATADAGLVPLTKGTARTTLPSKLYTIMSTGCPALVAVDLDSDIVKTVNDAQCGVAIAPDDVDALETAIRRAYAEQDQFKTLGENGRRYALENYSRAVVVQKYHELFELLASS